MCIFFSLLTCVVFGSTSARFPGPVKKPLLGLPKGLVLTETTCGHYEWEPPRIDAKSLSGKAIHKRKLTDAQEEGERIVVNEEVFAKHSRRAAPF